VAGAYRTARRGSCESSASLRTTGRVRSPSPGASESSWASRPAAVRILGANGYRGRAQSEPSGEIRLFADLAEPVDILMTDIDMPGLSGVQRARRAVELRPGLPVLYNSGYPQELIAHRSTPAVGSNVMQKPFTRRVLLERIAEAIGTSRPRD
jgi:CheY-like chemotaxis protein